MKSNELRIKHLGLFFVFLLTINSVDSAEKQKKWCWTRSMANEPTFTLDPKNGGMNWGFCQAPNKKGLGAVSKYTAIVETSSVPLSETTSGIRVKLYGDLGKSDLASLGDNFERGSTKKVSFTAPDVGKIQQIKLNLEGSQPFRCKKITIKNGAKTFTFQCLRKLEACTSEDPHGPKCNMKLIAEGNVPYEITVKANDAPGSGSSSPVLVSVIGKKGQGQWKLLTDKGIRDGGAETKRLMADDVGDIVGFELQIPEPGKLVPAYVRIKNMNSKAIRVFEVKNILLKNPGKDRYRVDSGAAAGPKGPNSPVKNPEKDKDEGNNINNPYGGQLSGEDRKRIVQLKCDTKLENPSSANQIFGPDYPTNHPNYMNVLARCPAECHKLKEKVIGLGIHPYNTPICMAALVDNAISFYGGIINISILPGISKYTFPKKFKHTKGQRIKDFEGSTKKSFSVMKVDNVDLVEKDIRILDHKGELSHEGRLEVRREGEWGTICALENNRLAAKRICRDIGYRDGEWKSPKDQSAKNYCKSFKSEDYCGAKKQAIHFMAVKCTDTDQNFNRCNKLLADTSKCTHGYDAIIRCFNQNYEKEKTIPQGVVRLEKGKAKGIHYTGRLEMYKKKEFLPLCNIGFTDNSAMIACKQMGWEQGKAINDPIKAKQYQLDIKSTKKFSAEGMACSGTESKVKDCKYNANNIRCKHDQDVVVQCSNGKGDPTGKSQYVKPVYNPPPALGKLKIARFKVSCVEKGNVNDFRGDPGSLYIIECPKHCGRIHGSVWGTGIYTSNSHICRAAIHAGVIQSEQGGSFIMERTHGIKYYEGSDINNIITTKYIGQWPASIVFSTLISGYVNMYRSLKKSSFISSYEGLHYSSSSTLPVYYSSFIQSSNNDIDLPVPTFQWIPKDFLYTFSPTTSLLIGEHNIKNLENYTILMRFKMQDFKRQRMFLFSYSGCNGFNILINQDDALEIGDICNPSKRFMPGFMIPLNDKVLFYMKHKKGKIHLRIFSYATKKTFEKKIRFDLTFPAQGAIGLGRMAAQKQDFFLGKIDFFQFYLADVDVKLLDEVINNIKIKPIEGAKPKELTVDNRKCVSPCTSNPLPGNPGAGNPPNEANPFQAFAKKAAQARAQKAAAEAAASAQSNSGMPKGNSQGGQSSGSGSESNGSGPSAGGSSGTFNMKKAGNIESTDLTCQTNLNDKRFSGAPGKIFRVTCKNCVSEKGAVFGTMIYHPLSSICKAASHAGVLEPNKGGTFLIQIVVGAPAYNGSPGADKTTSATFAGADKSFIVLKAPPLTKIACGTAANSAPFSTASISKKFVVLCPPGCSKGRGEVYGTGVYTDTSAICVAAIHYGMLSDKGGEVSFMITKGENSYQKSKGFGIISKSKGPHIRSFKFLGKRSAISYKWSENYSPQFSQKWGINVHPNADNKVSNFWSYIVDDNFIIDGQKIKMRAITHTGKVTNKHNIDFGSWIHLKDADFANGKFKFNFLLYDLKPIGALFRYTNKENFYAVEFSASSTENVKLIKSVDGATQIIATKTAKILTDKWYRVVIIMDYDTIKVQMQSHSIRQHKTLFRKTITNGLSRGTIGFASRGNTKFYLNGINIDEYHPDRKEKFNNNKRSWHSILKSVKQKQRKIYCYSLFSLMKEEIPRCMEVHNYCRIRCDKHIPTVETILNFSCQRDCVRTANALDNKSDELSRLSKKATWTPKKGDKCDFLPNGEKIYRMGLVKEVEQRSDKFKVTVEYLEPGAASIKAEVMYPTASLKRCGEVLTARSDCMLN